MCDFNNLDDGAKQAYHEQLTECADSFGGMNVFLQLIEALRECKTDPLIAKECEFRFDLGTIKWQKVIFKDKLTLLVKERVKESKRGNFLPEKDAKSYKNVLNLVRTLKPIKFRVQRKNKQDGAGFTINAFDMIDDDTTRINPIFDALFFCSIDTVKKVLNYKAKS